LLYGKASPESRVEGYRFRFTSDPPDAIGIDVRGSAESRSAHTAYRDGITEWCGNCHGRYHQGGGPSGSPTNAIDRPRNSETIFRYNASRQVGGPNASFFHPVDRSLSAEMISRFNAYRGTGFLDGDGTDAYLPELPIEHPDATVAFRGPIAQRSRVTCLTCHRAHASSAPAGLRWDPNIDTWAEEGRRSGSYPIPNPYESTAGPAQAGLCEKCHEPAFPTAAPDPLRAPLLDPTLNRRPSTPRVR
jgi:predicted CXXCH cytochrome family protein